LLHRCFTWWLAVATAVGKLQRRRWFAVAITVAAVEKAVLWVKYQ